jgi:putative phosphonate metabolism protein
VRVALYYAPALSDPLWRAGNAWLGRDPETDERVVQPSVPGIAEFTEEPRRYGFHATLKPPMRLRSAWGDFLRDAEDLAARTAPFQLPPLAVTDLSGFLALRETLPCPALQSFADACVESLDAHRVPPDEEELARRRRARLSPEEHAMLERWGYPYVFSTFRFHMTLTRRLSAEEQARVRPVVEAYLAPVLAVDRWVSELCLFTEAAPGASFLLARRLPLGG